MENINEYLDKHKIKKFNNCTQYSTVKACVLASLDNKLAYYKDDIYFYDGKAENINYMQITKDNIEIPLFTPY